MKELGLVAVVNDGYQEYIPLFIYFALAYISQLDFPSNQFKDVDAGSVDVMLAAGGQFLNVFFTAAYVAGCVGSALTSQASVSRILYAMGRDGILPRPVFGYINVRFGTPVFAILVVSAADGPMPHG